MRKSAPDSNFPLITSLPPSGAGIGGGRGGEGGGGGGGKKVALTVVRVKGSAEPGIRYGS